MSIALLLSLLGLCATGSAALAGHQLLQSSSSPDAQLSPLKSSDVIIVYTTTHSRLPLVHATRPARRGIRTYIVLQNESEASRLNDLYGGPQSQHNETYLAWQDLTNPGGSRTFVVGDGGGGGSYGRPPPPPTHLLHLLGPTWAMAPVLAHAAVLSASSTSSSLPYLWMLIARDDTLWLLHRALRLLSKLDAGVAAAVSDHLVDFNGLQLLSPSSAAAVCLPCATNLTALLGRCHPPGVPQPACPVCRPSNGCEFRFELCGGLVGGPHCGSKRFLGSGDRCAHSWAAGGAGMALSNTLLSYIDQADWTKCVRGQRLSTGERTLGQCLWRNGFAFTHPATGLVEGRTREVFSDRHLLFGSPLLREDMFGSSVALLASKDKGEEDAAAAMVTEAVVTAAASTRLRPHGATVCDTDCRTWLARHGVSVHLDVPYADDVDIAAAAALLQRAAESEAVNTAEP